MKVVDQVTGSEYSIRTRFHLVRIDDGAWIAKQLDSPFMSIPGGTLAYNVLVRADFGQFVRRRESNLLMFPRLNKDYPFVSVARIVKPWIKW